MSENRPKRPQTKFPGIQAVWSGKSWKFRARTRRSRGGNSFGAVRKTQAEASDDYRQLKGPVAIDWTKKKLTLGEAITEARREAQLRGVKPITLKAHFGSHAGYPLSFWEKNVPMESLQAQEVAWFIRRALDQGRNPNTLIGKDLLILRQAFEAARVPSPVAEATKITRLRRKPSVKAGMEFEVALHFLKTVREAGTPRCSWHADVMEFALWTGARSGELTSLTIDQVDFEFALVQLDGKTGPRSIAMDDLLAEVAKRLIEDAITRDSKDLIPGGMSGLTQIISRWSKSTGIKVSARGLRHTVALGMVEAGLSLDRVRDQLGHAKITTTAEYLNRRHVTKVESLMKLRSRFSSAS